MGNRERRFSVQIEREAAAVMVSTAIGKLSSAMILALLFVVAVTPKAVRAQGGCDPLTLEILDTPGLAAVQYAILTGGYSTLTWESEGGYALFDVAAMFISTNQYAGPSGSAGSIAGAWFSADMEVDQNYTQYVVVDGDPAFESIGTLSTVGGTVTSVDVIVSGVYSRTFAGGTPAPYDHFYVRINGHNGLPKNSYIYFSGRWKVYIVPEFCPLPEDPEEPPEPEPDDFCPDGMEVLNSTVLLPPGNVWEDTVETPYNKLSVRYTFTEPGANALLHYVDLRANEAQVIRQYYGDQMQEWDPVEGWTNNGYSFMVPNNADEQYADFDPTSYVTGTWVDLHAGVGYNALNLVSVCVVPYYGPSELCPDGTEALSDGPVYLPALTGAWETVMPITSTHVVVRYSVDGGESGIVDPDRRQRGKFMPGIEFVLFYVESIFPPDGLITFTLPTTNVVKLYDSELYLEFYNRNVPVTLNSVCVIDATEYWMVQLRPEECHLNNPDFVSEPDGGTDWTTIGTVDWTDLEENGVVSLGPGEVYQGALLENEGLWDDDAGVWTLEVRAKDDGGGEMQFGTDRSSFLDGGPQIDTVELDASYRLYQNDIFVMNQNWIQVASPGGIVDYVCLLEPGNVFGDPDDMFNCVIPEWDPQGSGDSLFIYLFRYIADWIKWAVCELLRVLSIILNKIWRAIQDILYRIPALPEPGSGLISWVEFFKLLAEAFQDFFGINLTDLQNWLATIVNSITRWFGNQWDRFIVWLDWLLYDIVAWLADQFGIMPNDIFDLLYDIVYEARLFWLEMVAEMESEMSDALHLLVNMADVLIVLASGVREGVTGDSIAYIGSDFEGLGGFIWDGVDFVNEVADMTPLSGLNILALGIITFGLMVWTGKKFLRMLESFG